MFVATPMLPQHATRLVLCDEQSIEAKLLEDSSYVDALIASGPAYTALVDGRVVGCGGVAPLAEDVAEAWAFVGRDAAPHLMRITLASRRFLRSLRWPRIQTHVPVGFEQGHRWARLLGFVAEPELARNYSPDGRDFAVYRFVP